MNLLQFISILSLGFLLGLKHALDADHIAAVSTIVSDTSNFKTALFIGVIWGLGHTTTLAIVGFFILYFKLSIPNELALSFEFIVGIALVLLGIGVLRKFKTEKANLGNHFNSHNSSINHTHFYKSFGIGMLHGLAGSAALLLIIISLSKSVLEGMYYIAIFGLGSILGMFLCSGVIGIPFLFKEKIPLLGTVIKFFSGAISITLGVIIMYRISIIAI